MLCRERVEIVANDKIVENTCDCSATVEPLNKREPLLTKSDVLLLKRIDDTLSDCVLIEEVVRS